MHIVSIRPDQIAALERRSVERFREEMIAELRREQPDTVATLSDRDLGAIVDYGIALCETYDITAEPQVGAYVHLMVGFGADFDEEPWAAEILLDDELSEEDKLTQLALFADVDPR